MSELKKMEMEIHHEKLTAEHLQRREEHRLKKAIEREAEEFKALSSKNI